MVDLIKKGEFLLTADEIREYKEAMAELEAMEARDLQEAREILLKIEAMHRKAQIYVVRASGYRVEANAIYRILYPDIPWTRRLQMWWESKIHPKDKVKIVHHKNEGMGIDDFVNPDPNWSSPDATAIPSSIAIVNARSAYPELSQNKNYGRSTPA